LNGTVNEAKQRMTMEATSKENDYNKHTLLITSKAGTWELLINYFKQHYGNKLRAVDNRKWPSLPIITQWVKTAWDYIDPAIITIARKMMYCGLNSMKNLTLTPTKKATTCIMT